LAWAAPLRLPTSALTRTISEGRMSTEIHSTAEHSNGSSVGSFVIEHGVPLPTKAPKPKKEKKGRSSKYPWASMAVGDSVFFEAYPTKTINSAVQAQAKKIHPGSKWKVLTVEGGVRVWRLV